VVTREHKVALRPIADAIRPIQSGILTRRGEQLSPAASAFIEQIRETSV
jgi:DNA-binding transcriptional LysR family regulator